MLPSRRSCASHIPYHNPNTAIAPKPYQHADYRTGVPISEVNPYASNMTFLNRTNEQLLMLSKHVADPYDSRPLYNGNNPSGMWGAPNVYYDPML